MKRIPLEWITIVGIFISHLHGTFSQDNDTLNKGRNKTARDIFSPRMDYDQWKPLGRGDPLKDDPTFDYVPPVLDRVHYWIDPASRKPDQPNIENRKTEILLLGVSSKKPSTASFSADSRKDVYNSFIKFVDGPKFNNHQRVSRPQFNSDYFNPFYNNHHHRNKFSERVSYSKESDQRVPYTILVPPPIMNNNNNRPSTSQALPLTTYSDFQGSSFKPTEAPEITSISTTTSTSGPYSRATPPFSSDVTIQSSNLVYSSSSLGNIEEWKKPSTETNKYNKYLKKTTPLHNLVLPNIERFNHNFEDSKKPMPESYIEIDFNHMNDNINNSSQKPLLQAGSDQSINFIAAPFSSNIEIMHKGQVSDDNLDISNTYVKIGKTEAQVHASDGIPIPIITQSMNPHSLDNIMVFSHIQHPMTLENNLAYTPLTMQTIQDMQTMQPPPVTMSPIFTRPSPSGFKKNEINEIMPTTSTIIYESNKESTTPETTTEILTTTTSNALTTDPLFKHYKQPIELIRGPLYLIIQGHSKVKTYGPNKSIHGIAIQETNEISDGREEERFEVNHLHGFSSKIEEERGFREGRSSDELQTLKHVIQTGLGAINSSELKDELLTFVDRRNDIQEAEVQSGFEVMTGEVTSEKYHKGIVEAARKLRDSENT